jgi:hypothetical protein
VNYNPNNMLISLRLSAVMCQWCADGAILRSSAQTQRPVLRDPVPNLRSPVLEFDEAHANQSCLRPMHLNLFEMSATSLPLRIGLYLAVPCSRVAKW